LARTLSRQSSKVGSVTFEAFERSDAPAVGYAWLKCDAPSLRNPRRNGRTLWDGPNSEANPPVGSAEVAFHLYRPEDSERGLGTWIAQAITQLALGHYGYERVWVSLPRSRDWCAASVRIAEKIGYQRCRGRRSSITLERVRTWRDGTYGGDDGRAWWA